MPQHNPEIAPIYLILLGLCLYYLVPGGGVEPPRPCDRRILSPLRLPVPPSRLRVGIRFQSIAQLFHVALWANTPAIARLLAVAAGRSAANERIGVATLAFHNHPLAREV